MTLYLRKEKELNEKKKIKDKIEKRKNIGVDLSIIDQVIKKWKSDLNGQNLIEVMNHIPGSNDVDKVRKS